MSQRKQYVDGLDGWIGGVKYRAAYAASNVDTTFLLLSMSSTVTIREAFDSSILQKSAFHDITILDRVTI